VFVRDLEGIVTYWNRGAEELYGWPREEASGQNFHTLARTIFPAPLETIQADLMRNSRWDGELAQVRADGSWVTVASRWALRRDERGRPVGILETNTDITSRIEARDALHRAQAELAHVTRITTLGELTASIAHEVNQPLAAIVANGQACLRWLKRDVPDLSEAQSAVERMVADGKRAGEVIWGLRMLARKADPQWEVLALNEVIESALVLVQRELHSHQVALKLSLSPGLPPICGDRVQLQQVVINLMVNGMQAMGSVDDRPRTLLVATERHEADQALVKVRDVGVGITNENLDRLFQAFFTTRADGMGMGLSICRSIVEAHEGRIWASRNEGPGVTMQFTLPIMEEKSS
jgi:PAS domain S-box-containing protein